MKIYLNNFSKKDLLENLLENALRKIRFFFNLLEKWEINSFSNLFSQLTPDLII